MPGPSDDKTQQKSRLPLKPDARTRGGAPAEVPPRVLRRVTHGTHPQRPTALRRARGRGGAVRGVAGYRGALRGQRPVHRAPERQRGQTARAVDERLMELQALFDVSKVLNSSLSLLNILNTLLLTPMGRMMLGKGMVLLKRGEGPTYVVETLKGMPRELIGQQLEIDYGGNAPFALVEIEEQPWTAFLRQHGLKLGAPIISNSKQIGMMVFSGKLNKEDFSGSELEYLQSLSNLAATAIENGMVFQELREVNRRLDKKIQELNTVFEIAKELNATLDSDRIVNLLGLALMGELITQRCLIFIEENGKLRLRLAKGVRQPGDLALADDSVLQRGLMQLTQPHFVGSLPDEELRARLQELQIAVASPMQSQETVRGAVLIGEKITGAEFLPHELEFLATLGNTALISLENARLFGETIEKQRLEEELAIAREIQQRLLPKGPPNLANIEIAAVNLPTYQVGGDYYDYFAIDDHRYIVSIADVSGKGIPAALLMANLQATLHAMIPPDIPLQQIVVRINHLLYHNTTSDKFITLFIGILDAQERTFTSVNAGHNFPFLCHADGTLQTLEKGGLLLGMIPNVAYEMEMHHLRSGDCIFMYTDGISEAMNAHEEEFSEARILAVLRAHLGSKAPEILSAMTDAVRNHAAGIPGSDTSAPAGSPGEAGRGALQSDDITMVVLKVH